MTPSVTAAELDGVSEEWDPLFAAGPGFQSSRAWFEATVEAALPPGCRAEFLLCRDNGRPAAMLPLLRGPGRQARGLSTVYTCLFQPLLARGLADRDIRRTGAALAPAGCGLRLAGLPGRPSGPAARNDPPQDPCLRARPPGADRACAVAGRPGPRDGGLRGRVPAKLEAA